MIKEIKKASNQRINKINSAYEMIPKKTLDTDTN